MPRFAVDLDNVEKSMSKRMYKLADVQHKIEKIAFDVVKFSDGSADELWQVQEGEDGNKYIVALYNEDEKVATAALKPSWSVAVKNADLHVFYKQEHLCKVASADLGIPESELGLVKNYLPRKLASSPNLVSALFKTLDDASVKQILSKYPELA